MLGAIGDKLLKVFESIVQWFFESLIEPFKDLPTLKKLVFGEHKEGKLVWGTFEPTDLTLGFEPLFNTMAILSGFVLVALIVVYGMRIAGAPLNPSRRNESIEFIKDLVFVGIVLVNLPTLYDLLFTINSSVVNLFAGSHESNLDNIKKDFLLEEGAKGVIGLIFVQLVLLGLTIWASFYYLMRKVTLIILMSMGPLMLAFWLSPRFKSLTGSWFKELVGSIFVQAIHAFVFWTVAVLSATSTGIVETVIVYVIFIPISESIRRLFNMGGDMQGGFAKAGAMMGMAGLAGMYGAAKGAFDGKGVTGSLKNAYEGVKNNTKGKDAGGGDDLKKTLGADAGGDAGTSTRAEKMLRAGDVVGKMGKATFGMAGAVAGMGLGPVGAMAGATAGFELGGVAGGLTGRVGAAAVQGIGTRLNKGIGGAKAFKTNSSQGFEEELSNEVADRSTASWADENKGAQLAGLRERFPDASDGEIASKFDAIKEQKRSGFYNDAKNNLQASNLYDGKSKPNTQNLASGLAGVKTAQMGDDFVNSQIARGVSGDVARRDWNDNHKPQAHAKNLEMFKGSVDQASNNSFGTFNAGSAAHKVAVGAGQAGAFVLGAAGITGGAKILAGGYRAVAEGSRAAVVANSSLHNESVSGIKNIARNTIPSAKAGWRTATNQLAEQRGGAVEAQAGYQESAGYGTGMIFGTGGYQAAKKMANKFSPYSQSVQSAISSPGEAIQMAKTTTDDHGNVSLAQGAIRQVTTAQESYIEVATKSGERKIVSRKGSGHSGMREGDVVYQDLVADGDTLSASSPSTYRLDSAGGRAPSSVQVNSDPSTLLGSARSGQTHQPVARRQAPVFNQAVDNGSFYTNDLAAQGMDNVQVVVEKDRQFMTADKGGVTYRVSQVFSGDSRLQGSESVQIPVEVSNHTIRPKNSGNSTVAVQANVTSGGIQTSESVPYYSTKSTRGLIDNLEDLMTSKHADRANRSVNQRESLDAVRRKQGLLG
ncbi:hypothetical protein [Sporosarcina sp. FSL K6-1508]|uniref:hypothetical protein n=1 Tax=Sporosarcina sp. FSL K6-1508 TaxID=2921553 RepID=UPI0030FCB6C8